MSKFIKWTKRLTIASIIYSTSFQPTIRSVSHIFMLYSLILTKYSAIGRKKGIRKSQWTVSDKIITTTTTTTTTATTTKKWQFQFCYKICDASIWWVSKWMSCVCLSYIWIGELSKQMFYQNAYTYIICMYISEQLSMVWRRVSVMQNKATNKTTNTVSPTECCGIQSIIDV